MAAGEAVCTALEGRGLRCWIAPRDIIPGIGWAKSIVRAIGQSRIMVLVFSENANTSPQIEREVERAVNKGIPIIPLRIENVAAKRGAGIFPQLAALARCVQTAYGTAFGSPRRGGTGTGWFQPPRNRSSRSRSGFRGATCRAGQDACTCKPEEVASTDKTPGALFAGVQGTERNLIVVTALTSVAALVALLSAGAISLRSLF